MMTPRIITIASANTMYCSVETLSNHSRAVSIHSMMPLLQSDRPLLPDVMVEFEVVSDRSM